MNERTESQPRAAPQKPSEAEAVRAILETEHAKQRAADESSEVAPKPAARPTWVSSPAGAVFYPVMVRALIFFLARGAHRVVKGLLLFAPGPSNRNAYVAPHVAKDTARQTEALGLLERLAAGDGAAANQVLDQSNRWTGKTEATAKTDQLMTTSLNLTGLHARATSHQARLALNDIPREASGLAMLEQAAGNPRQCALAKWVLGSVGSRGVDPAQAAKVVEANLNTPDVSICSNAVIGLELLGTDETIPMAVDRFRNGPSMAVQELAGCGLVGSSMYTRTQRIVAATALVGWPDDSFLSPQQRTWAAQALHGISGQDYGKDSTACQRRYEGTRSFAKAARRRLTRIRGWHMRLISSMRPLSCLAPGVLGRAKSTPSPSYVQVERTLPRTCFRRNPGFSSEYRTSICPVGQSCDLLSQEPESPPCPSGVRYNTSPFSITMCSAPEKPSRTGHRSL
jgi:hypothetical protein